MKFVSVAASEAAFDPRSVLPPRGHIESRRAAAQSQRRRLILAAARQMLAEGGLSSVHIRTLAQRSGVTPPTIYNLIGAREDVVLRAMREAVEDMGALAARHAEAQGVNEIIAYCHTVTTSLEADPDYYRQIDHAAARAPSGERLILFFEELMRPMFSSWLALMKARGDLRQTSVDLDVVTSILVQQQISTGLAWARDEIDVGEYRRRLVAGAALVLLGLVSAREAARIEPWLPKVSSV
ncbi:MAG TPA: TetR/AcrR family transcriptional regulator [Steroidobacteraceae bacterium]|nr:TetR/AcrR family transcriptional regulator [Steroidobacteraceae bacterium]